MLKFLIDLGWRGFAALAGATAFLQFFRPDPPGDIPAMAFGVFFGLGLGDGIARLTCWAWGRRRGGVTAQPQAPQDRTEV